MSLAVALNNALSGLQSNEAVIQTISNNITNANTEGYTRKTTDQVSRTLDAQGRGVDTSDIKRVVDERLLSDLRRNLSVLASSRVEDSYYQRIIDQFGSLASNSTLGAGIGDLSVALQGLSASPESTAAQIDVVTKADSLARQLKRMNDEIQGLRFDADRDIATKIDSLNAELKTFADLNTKIESAQALGEPTAELEDFRDRSLNTISEMIDIRYFKRTTGAVVITLPDGKLLADRLSKSLSHVPSAALSASVSYPSNGITPVLLNGVDVTASLGTGELGALVGLRDTILPNMQAEIDLLTQTLRDQLNAVHNAGAAFPPANTLTGSRSFAAPVTDQITLTATARIAVVDQAGKFIAHHDLAAGTYTIDQIETAIDTNLTGFATASTSLGGPLQISATSATHGIAIVDFGVQSVTHTDGKATFTGFSNYFGLNDLFVTPGNVEGDSNAGLAGLIQVRTDILSNPNRLSRGALIGALTPAPQPGDVAIAPGDASIAEALADKFVAELTFAAAGKLPPTTTTLSGYASDFLSKNAVDASIATDDVAFRETLAQEQSFRAQEISGVNIDEELQNMVLYENAYGATARVFQVVDDLLEILINLGR